MFLMFLLYKAASAGRQVIRVDPRGTSQTCLCDAPWLRVWPAERNRHAADVMGNQDSVFLSGQMENGQIVHVVNGLRPEIHGRVTAEYTTHDSPIQIVIGLNLTFNGSRAAA